MKKKNGFFNMFFTSIYDLSVFSAYVKRGMMKSVIYAILMILILGGIQLGIESYKMNNIITDIIGELKSDEYDLKIEENTLKINKPFTAFNEGGNLVYFDPNLEVEDSEEIRKVTVHEDWYVLVLKNGVVFNELDNNHIIEYNLLLNNRIVTYNDLDNIKLVIISTFFICKLISIMFNFFINCLIVAMISSIITLFMKMLVKSKALYSLTIYASTLPFIMQTIFNIIRPDVDFDLVFMMGTLTYMSFILRYIKIDILERLNHNKSKI